MNYKNTIILSILFVGLISITSCKKDDPVIPNEEEVITTVTYTLTPVGDGDPVILQFRDVDGDGGMDPVYTTDKLAANTSYSGSIELLNETESPAEDVTEEVEEESDEHQFFFIFEGADADVAYNDEDANGNPIGLSSTLTTGDASTGILTLVLRHQPNKPNDGTLSDAGGETDLEVSFDCIIE